ncbi:uncharacterized protein [Dermacentor andersoni]|uniref:uncharacterized protein n=1 Tax=Dermacentor andersoni TaxID=34620 RepID=UPI002416B0FE|nr:uncharacterized protein LOC126538747 [Dermacentor andersoni]
MERRMEIPEEDISEEEASSPGWMTAYGRSNGKANGKLSKAQDFAATLQAPLSFLVAEYFCWEGSLYNGCCVPLSFLVYERLSRGCSAGGAYSTSTHDTFKLDEISARLLPFVPVQPPSTEAIAYAGPIRGVLPGDDEMYHLIIGLGQVPAQQYIVVAPNVASASLTTGSKAVNNSSTIDDCLQLNMLPWCLLILISAVVSFATTLLLFLFLDSDKTETTTVLEAEERFFIPSQMTPYPGPYISTWIMAAPNSSAA